MWYYLLKRIVAMIPTLIGVLTVTFLVTQFVPGGPVDHALNKLDDGAEAGLSEGSWSYTGSRRISAQQIQQLTVQFGFDKPLPLRYWLMLKGFAHFDLGDSYFRNQSVWSLIRARLGVSISIGVWTFLLTYLVSVPLGVAKAVRAGSRFDFISTLILLTGYAVPGFVLGVLLILLLGGGSFWDIFPLRGLTSDDWAQLSWWGRTTDYLWHVTLPVTASVISNFALKTLLTKNTFLDEIRRQYVLTARAKGLSEGRIMWKHVFRNALLPLITSFPSTFITAFFTGSLLIETLFSLDGMGLLSFESINNRDYPVVLGALYLFTLIGLGTRLIGDLAYLVVDPRIKFSAAEAK
jgi:microcin C transport system permease protein